MTSVESFTDYTTEEIDRMKNWGGVEIGVQKDSKSGLTRPEFTFDDYAEIGRPKNKEEALHMLVENYGVTGDLDLLDQEQLNIIIRDLQYDYIPSEKVYRRLGLEMGPYTYAERVAMREALINFGRDVFTELENNGHSMAGVVLLGSWMQVKMGVSEHSDVDVFFIPEKRNGQIEAQAIVTEAEKLYRSRQAQLPPTEKLEFRETDFLTKEWAENTRLPERSVLYSEKLTASSVVIVKDVECAQLLDKVMGITKKGAQIIVLDEI